MYVMVTDTKRSFELDSQKSLMSEPFKNDPFYFNLIPCMVHAHTL